MSANTRNMESSKDPASASTLPDPTATPDQVRAFISHLLRERGIDETYVKGIPVQWKIGSGREMRAYDPSMYLDIFGAEYGWIIYRDVKLRIHEDRCRKFTYQYAYELIVAAFAGFTALMVYICFCDLNALPLTVAIVAALSGILGLVVSVGAILLAGTAEEDIEMELRECRRRSSAKKD